MESSVTIPLKEYNRLLGERKKLKALTEGKAIYVTANTCSSEDWFEIITTSAVVKKQKEEFDRVLNLEAQLRAEKDKLIESIQEEKNWLKKKAIELSDEIEKWDAYPNKKRKWLSNLWK